MSFFRDFLQNLFGGGKSNESKNSGFDEYYPPKNGFRKPIWQNNEDNDDEYGDDYRNFTNSHQDVPFQIFTNPFGIMRYFESQMDNMMKDMMTFGLDDNHITGSFNDTNIHKVLLSPSNQNENNVRDQFLKPNFALQSINDNDNNIKIDRDLDGKITTDDISKVLKNPNGCDNNKLIQRFGDFTTKSNISMEHISTITDSAGYTETTVTRQIGDKIHTIITKRNKNGVETTAENFNDVGKGNFGLGPKIFGNTFGSILWDEFLGSVPK